MALATHSNVDAPEFISPRDHRAGFKRLAVTLRDGQQKEITVKAISAARLERIRRVNHVVYQLGSLAAKPEDLINDITEAAVENFDLAQLSDDSRELVDAAAYYLAVGHDEQKRLEGAFVAIVKAAESLSPNGGPGPRGLDAQPC